MKTRSFVIALTFLSVIICGQAQSQTGHPVKVGVKAQVPSAPGDLIDVKLVLLDAKNREAQADKDMLITVLAISLPHDTASQEVMIKAGQSSQKVSFPITRSGLMSIKAKQKELLEGGMHLRVTRRHGGAMLERGARFIYAAYRITQPPPHSIELVYSPERTILADGRDAAVVQAILLDEEMASTDIRITLVNDGGTLEPKVLVIPAGEDHAEAVLTSTVQGTIKVRFSHSHPTVSVQGASELQIKFGPPITRLVVKPSPPAIALVDNAELVAQLTDDNGIVVATDHEREVSFVIDKGRGKLEPYSIKIDSSKGEARAKLYPTWIGEIKLSSSTLNLATSSTTMEVKFPFLLTVLSIVGGGIGGLLAAWVVKKGYGPRSLVGMATGFVLYWGVLFGLFGTQLPLQFLLNPFVGFVLAISGGWLGTKVFEPLLKKFGVAGAEPGP